MPARLRHNRDLWVIAGGRAVSLLGDAVAATVLVLHAHAAGWGAGGVAAVIVCGSLPLVVAARAAGRLVDRVESRRLTVLAAGWEGTCALLLAVILAAAPSGAPGLVGCLLLLAALNAGQAVSGPAWAALLPTAVPEAAVVRALGAVQAAATVAGVSGAALGGALAGGPGPATALLLDAATFAVLAVAAMTVRARRLPRPAPAGDARSWPGLSVLVGDAVLAPAVTATVALVLCLHVILVARVFLVRDVLHGGPGAFGLIGTALPLGMLGGSLLAGRVAGARARFAGFAGLSVGVLACGLAPSLAALWAAQALMGLSFGVVGVLVNAEILRRVPGALHGQALAAYLGALQACDIGGTMLGGPLAAVLSPRAVHVVAGVLGLLVTAGAAAVGRPRIRQWPSA